MEFSIRSENIGSASSIEQNELVYKLKAEGVDPIILSYGEAPFSISQIHLSSRYWDRGSHYSESFGVPEFRKAIADYSKKYHGFSVEWNKNILVTAGSKIGSYYIFQTIMDPGHTLVLHEPSWVSYQEHAKLSGGNTRFIESDLSLIEGLNKTYRREDRVLCINNPNNPRGYHYGELEIRELHKFCYEHNMFFVIDESYSDFCTEGNFFSGGSLIQEGAKNVIVLNSISKNFGLSGWRLGYILSDERVIKKLNKINQHLMTCASTNLQLILAEELENIRRQVTPQIVALNKKRKEVDSLLSKYSIQALSGSSTFYHFLDLRGQIKDTGKFAIELLRDKYVSVIPGKAYGRSTEGFLRISFAIEPLSRIELGIIKIKEKLSSH